ncbi:MAG: class I mannose-6-phosphate isomerase [Selenomonadaceae bacterium]|nr:class I mannose-6-phosphate isomerase [Selenomonadaceae bacterium]
MYYPMKLLPALKEYIWGGRRLINEFHKETDLDNVAESWELASRAEGESFIANGRFKGLSMSEFVKKVGKKALGSRAERFSTFPLMVKLLDAKETLSVQVHPSNEDAKKFPGAEGKTELWYIIDAASDAKLLYGVNKAMNRDEFANHIKDGTLLDYCNYVNPKKGDVMLVSPGTLHAIGAGVLLLEVQQNSNTTYRVYDYERRGKDGKLRQLHVKEAVQVANLTPPKRNTMILNPLPSVGDAVRTEIGNNEHFRSEHISLKGNAEFFVGEKSFQTFTVIAGNLTIKLMEAFDADDEGALNLSQGDTVFLPANMGKFYIDGDAEFILSEI